MATAEAIVRAGVAAKTGADAREPAVRRGATRVENIAVEPVSEAEACSGEDRYRMIAEAAYFRAESRGFAAGCDLDDWLAAEIEVDDILAETGPRA
ncbi:MAG: DUF2934 domain-containing protein [Gammaproteobacteria bacterium]|nr:DUF2934 domain-containing protein [Gammaproteobacteria bacterium]